jgi:hypothetical protein
MDMQTDWLPAARAEIIAMSRNWISYMTPERRTAWGIPTAEFTELGTCQKACGFLAWEFAGRAA